MEAGCNGRCGRGDRSSALATSVILLTLLPVARHGRLAMLDGTQLTAMALLWLALLQLNRQPIQRTLGGVAGLMASAMLLLKAPLLVPAAVAGGLALAWGQEWKSWNNHAAALIGMLLGLAPGDRLASLACPHPREPGALALGRGWRRAGSSGCRRRQ